MTDTATPIAWIRRHPDGRLTDEVLPNWRIEEARKQSGAWTPLYAQQADAELARLRAECDDLRGGINVARSALALVQAECERLQVALTAQWVPMHERAPAPGAECVVLLRYALDKPPFASVDRWEEQREDPTGMGGPTIATGYGWNDNYDTDVIAWIAVPPHPPAEWDQRLPVPGAAT